MRRDDLTSFHKSLEQRETLLQSIAHLRASTESLPDGCSRDQARVLQQTGSPELWRQVSDLDHELLSQVTDHLDSLRQSLCLVRKQMKIQTYTSTDILDRPYLNQLR